MPRAPLPPHVVEFLRQPNPCVVATIRPDGELHTAATWYELQDDGTMLLNMDASRRRLAHIRADPRVALTVLRNEQWYRHVSLIGRVREIRADPTLADIDRLSWRYDGVAFGDRRRDSWTAIVGVQRWHTWGFPDSTGSA